MSGISGKSWAVAGPVLIKMFGCAALVTPEKLAGPVSITLEDSRLSLRTILVPAVYCRVVIPPVLLLSQVKSQIHFLTGVSFEESPGVQKFMKILQLHS